MDINDAMKMRRCIKELASGGKTLDELAAAVGLEEGETKDRFESFVLTLVIAELVGFEGQRYVLSDAFLAVATARFQEVYGGKTVYVKACADAHPGDVLNAFFGGVK